MERLMMGMVPEVGTLPVLIGGVLYLIGTGHKIAPMGLTGGAILIKTIDNVVRSWVMKGQAAMHPLLAILSAFGATSLMGPPGVFLGPIIAAVFVSFLQIVSMELRRERDSISP